MPQRFFVRPGPLIITALLALGLTACPSPIAPEPVPNPLSDGIVAQIEVTASTDAVQPKGSVQYTATARDAKGNPITGKVFSWSVSNKYVATVDPAGKVTGVNLGSVNIEAHVDGLTGSRKLQVYGLQATGGTFRLGGSSTLGTAFLFVLYTKTGQAPTGPVTVKFAGPSGWNADAVASRVHPSFGFRGWDLFPSAPVASGPFTVSTTLDGETLTSPPFFIDPSNSLTEIRADVFNVTATRMDAMWTQPLTGVPYRAILADLTAGVLIKDVFTKESRTGFTDLTLDRAHDYAVIVDHFADDVTANSLYLPPSFNVSRDAVAVPKVGWLDDGFGTNGFLNASTVFNGGFGRDGAILNVLHLTSGKFLILSSVIGGAFSPGGLQVMRCNADGSLDTGFGNAGKAVISGSFFDRGPGRFAVQADGSIVIVNSAYPTEVNLYRLTADGVSDTGFGTAGKTTVNVTSLESINDIAVRSNGKIVIGGVSFGSGGTDALVLQFNADGMPDTNFDGDGRLDLSLSPDVKSRDYVRKFLPLANGKVIIVGGADQGDYDQYDVALARLNTDGILDSSFGTNGISITPVIPSVSSYRKEIRDALLMDDGRIAVLVQGWRDFLPLPVFARFTANGLPDTTFGTNGALSSTWSSVQLSNLAVRPVPQSLAVQSDGKLVATGLMDHLVLMRVNANGTPDAGFGAGGLLGIRKWGGYVSSAFPFVLTNGNIAVVGQTNPGYTGAQGPLVFARLLP